MIERVENTTSDEEIMMIEEIIADDVRKTFWKTTIVEKDAEVFTIAEDEEETEVITLDEVITIDEDEDTSDLRSIDALVIEALENPQEWLMNGQTGTV